MISNTLKNIFRHWAIKWKMFGQGETVVRVEVNVLQLTTQTHQINGPVQADGIQGDEWILEKMGKILNIELNEGAYVWEGDGAGYDTMPNKSKH
jgi:hypothetical protein